MLLFKKLKYLPSLLSSKEKKTILVLSGIILICLVFLVTRWFILSTKVIPQPGGKYIEGVVGQPKYINPLYFGTNDVDDDLTSLIFSGLMKFNSKGEIVLDLAESYEISKDEKNYIFRLKENIKWHDGESLTADDVVFTCQAIKNPEFQSPLQAKFEGVTCEKVDQKTVKFTLIDEPYAPFLLENSTFGIIPKHLWENISPQQALLSEHNLEPIGSGPFQFKEFKKDKKTGKILFYTLTRFNNYHLSKSYLEGITFRFYENDEEALHAYNKNEIMGLGLIMPSQITKIKRKIALYNLNLSRYYAVFFNQPKNEALQDKKVRKALAFSLDRDQIIDETLQGKAISVYSPILPYQLGYNIEIEKYDLNLEKSHELLHQAGWQDIDKEGYRWKEGVRLEFTLTLTDNPDFLKMGEILKSQWKKIGLKLNIKAFETSKLSSEVIPARDYEALLYGIISSHDPDPYAFWHSSQRKDPGLNLTSFKDKSADNLLEEARKVLDIEKRTKKYLHFQNILADELPALFLYSPCYQFGVSKKIKGIEPGWVVSPSERFNEITSWYIKTKRAFKD